MLCGSGLPSSRDSSLASFLKSSGRVASPSPNLDPPPSHSICPFSLLLSLSPTLLPSARGRREAGAQQVGILGLVGKEKFVSCKHKRVVFWGDSMATQPGGLGEPLPPGSRVSSRRLSSQSQSGMTPVKNTLEDEDACYCY
eukprot:scaffold57208_cov31-Tisochrysis_lutea.AAC.4